MPGKAHTPEVGRAHSALASTTRWYPDNAEALTAARRDLKDAKAAAYVKRLVAESPPISDAMRVRLASILLAPAASHTGGDDTPPAAA